MVGTLQMVFGIQWYLVPKHDNLRLGHHPNHNNQMSNHHTGDTATNHLHKSSQNAGRLLTTITVEHRKGTIATSFDLRARTPYIALTCLSTPLFSPRFLPSVTQANTPLPQLSPHFPPFPFCQQANALLRPWPNSPSRYHHRQQAAVPSSTAAPAQGRGEGKPAWPRTPPRPRSPVRRRSSGKRPDTATSWS